jgi:phage baseplate assembly protein V
MSNDLIAAIRTLVMQSVSALRVNQKAVVTSYDPLTHMAKVRLEPQDLESGWLQVGTLAIGNGFGFSCGLTPGDEVIVAFEGGDINSGVVVAALFNGQERPVKTEPGEFKVVHKSGSYFKFFNDGTVEIVADEKMQLNAQDLVIAAVNLTQSVSGVLTTNTATAVSWGPSAATANPAFNPGIHTAATTKKED